MVRVIHTTSSLVPEAGGPARSVPGLCSALSELGFDVHILAADLGDQYSDPLISPENQFKVNLLPCRFHQDLKPIWIPGYRKTLMDLSKTGEQVLIHDHGLWLPRNRIAQMVSNNLNIPLVVSTRGMLEPWALQFGRGRKWLAWVAYQKKQLADTSVLHATSREEAAHLSRLGLKRPIALIPNGVKVPTIGFQPNDKPPGGGRILFLSRIHPKKGLLNLVEAVKRLSLIDWEVVIAGYDELGHLEEVRQAVQKSSHSDMFRFIGPVENQKKWDLYSSADIFVLPTYSENFGMVVAEALACGVPVLTTKGTPWGELISHECGWWVEPTIEGLAAGLEQALMCSAAERKRMGENGRVLVQQKYSWAAVAKKMITLYDWVLGLGEKPELFVDEKNE